MKRLWIEELLRVWFSEWLWCERNGVKKRVWEIWNSEIVLSEWKGRELDFGRVEIERSVCVNVVWKMWDKIDVREVMVLGDLLEKGDGGYIVIGGEEGGVEWRWVIERDDEERSDGFVVDSDKGCCWFVISGRLKKMKGGV